MKHFLALIALAALSSADAAQKLTYADLAGRLINLEHLATLPDPAERCAQFSSYDRKSGYDSATGKYFGWDANGDNDGVMGQEGNQFVLGEVKGPGCIWRIWSAMPKPGRVRIYLDGAAEPAIDLPFTDYFNGKQEPFTRPALVHVTARGWNNYTPIPFEKSCRIVADPDWGQYYQFVYTTFPKGTKVPTFKMKLSDRDLMALDLVQSRLEKCDPIDPPADAKPRITTQLIPAKTSQGMAAIAGPAAIVGFRLKLDPAATAKDLDLLRALSLQIRWDNETTPSVWAPLGDFFGTAPGANPYRSLPLGLTEDGTWYCNWFMPFNEAAEIKINNDGETAVKVRCELFTKKITRSEAQKYARFHAKWHRDAFQPTEPERAAIDWTMLKTEGRGRFAGVMLHIWNPRGSWWGEGDEKFFIDGEKFPSTIGTGSEDYFGYAWCDPGLFQNAFHNQTRNDGNNRGHVSVNRWHISDNIPFQTSFDGAIEKYFKNERPTLYAATAYWYQAPGGSDPYLPVPVSDRLGYWTPVQVFQVPGAIEGEQLKIISKSAGNPHEQDLTAWQGQWSRDAHLWWIEAKPGDKLVLGLPVQKAGKYRVTGHFTKAPDYGIVQLSLGDEVMGDKIDLFDARVRPFGPVDLGVHELIAGENKLTVEIIGANPKAIKSYMFGLDYLKLEAQ